MIAQLQATYAVHIVYVGSNHGIEKKLIQRAGIAYYAIMTGKLRRYFSWKNFLTPFQVLLGIMQSIFLCRRLKPNCVFSKGGFVAFPLVLAAWCNRIPVIVHESDLNPGLANRLSFPFARRICLTFPETQNYFSNPNRCVITGLPLRGDILKGRPEQGLRYCNFNADKPVLLVLAGGLGSTLINHMIRRLLPRILPYFQIVHLCGNGKMDSQFSSLLGYRQFTYLNEELADILAMASLVLSRAGATTLFELLALKKPHILLPLSLKASRGDQIDNARYFEHRGISKVLYPDDVTDERLVNMILMCYENLSQLQKHCQESVYAQSTQHVVDEIIMLLQTQDVSSMAK